MSNREKAVLCFAYAVGGGVALTYQIVWFHALVDQFGATGTTFLVVLSTFIGALGAGSLSSLSVYRWIDARIGGWGLKNYGRTELAIAVTGIGLLGITRLPLSPLLGDFPYEQEFLHGIAYWTPKATYQFMKILTGILVVGVPCFLMGLTFPYLCSLCAEDSAFPSRLYAANTLGASISVIVVEFWGLEILGYRGCLSIAALGNLFIAFWFLNFPRMKLAAAPASTKQQSISIFPGLWSGFACGGLQALSFILLKMTLGPSKLSYAMLTFFAILGIWLASSVVRHRHPPRKFLIYAAWIGLIWCVAVWLLEPRISTYLVVMGIHNLSFLSSYAASFLIAATAIGIQIFVPYSLWSMLLPDLCDRLQSRGFTVSRVYGLNTLCFLAGILVFGWGLQYVHFFFAAKVFGLVTMIGLMMFTLNPSGKPMPARYLLTGSLILLPALPLISRDLNLRLLGGIAEDRRFAEDYRSTPQHLFWVHFNRRNHVKSLMFDNHSMSGTSIDAHIYMRGMAHFPLLMHRDPRTALLICFGVGNTADAIRMHDSIARVDIVDLNRAVFELNSNFVEENQRVLHDPRVRIIIEDGRMFLKVARQKYDFVTLEPPPPLLVGTSRLYSEEFYQAILKKLNPGGIVSQWMPEQQLDQRAVDMIASTFVQSFPHTFLFVGYGYDLVLVGSNEPFEFDRVLRTPSSRVQRDFDRLGVHPPQFFRSILAVEQAMKQNWGLGETISDGFTSLEAIQVMPAQGIHPASEFKSLKPNLKYNVLEVLTYLQKTAPEAAKLVSTFYADPFSDPATQRIVPRKYFSLAPNNKAKTIEGQRSPGP